MNWLTGFWKYFMRVLMPARYRTSALESRFITGMEKASQKVDKPHEAADLLVDSAAKDLDKRGAGGPEAAAGGAAAATAAPVKSRWSTVGTIFRWTLHLLLLALILWGLWHLNRMLGVERLLRSDWPMLHPYWLPLLFLLLYGLAWLGWCLWQLTGPEHAEGRYPDLDDAWYDAALALADAGIDVRAVPLFLVLGSPEGPEDYLFDMGLRLQVRQTPRGAGAPLHVYASKEAVFLSCPGTSVLAEQLRLMARERQRQRERVSTSEQTDLAETLGTANAGAAGPDAVSPEEQRVLGLLVAEEEEEQPQSGGTARAFLKNTAEVKRLTRRLQHLCRLLIRDRRPYCPINGILLVVPFPATDDDREASQVGSACRHDVQLLYELLQVRCPAVALVTDAEQAPGFRELLQRLPAGQRVRRLGQRFPLMPDVDDQALARVLDDGVSWLCNAVLPSLVYNLCRVDRAANRDAEDPLESNGRLYRLLAEMRARRQRLSRLLTRGLLMDTAGPLLFGGVYLAATSPDVRPALVSGVLSRLIESQNYVAWTHEALAEDASYRWWTYTGWLFVLFLLVGVPTAAYFLWRA